MMLINDPDSLIAKADLAFEEACRTVIDRARHSNTEIGIWRDGRIVELSPDEAARELESNLARRRSDSKAEEEAIVEKCGREPGGSKVE